MPLYEEKLISPLAIRFSQTRIRETFRDGHTLEESFRDIVPVEAPSGSVHDAVLDVPFPPIEVVRWRPKLRDSDGCALENDAGEALHGEECWFTLDNRRLYCLQKAAAEGLPKCCAAVVRVMYDIPTVRSIARKFKTTTAGNSVKISAHHDTATIVSWDWKVEPHVVASRSKVSSFVAFEQVRKDIETRDHSLLPDLVPDTLLGKPLRSDSWETQELDSRSSSSCEESGLAETETKSLSTYRPGVAMTLAASPLPDFASTPKHGDDMKDRCQQQPPTVSAEQLWLFQQQHQQAASRQQWMLLQQVVLAQHHQQQQQQQQQQQHIYEQYFYQQLRQQALHRQQQEQHQQLLQRKKQYPSCRHSGMHESMKSVSQRANQKKAVCVV